MRFSPPYSTTSAFHRWLQPPPYPRLASLHYHRATASTAHATQDTNVTPSNTSSQTLVRTGAHGLSSNSAPRTFSSNHCARQITHAHRLAHQKQNSQHLGNQQPGHRANFHESPDPHATVTSISSNPSPAIHLSTLKTHSANNTRLRIGHMKSIPSRVCGGR